MSHDAKRLKKDYAARENHTLQYMERKSYGAQENSMKRRLHHLPIRHTFPNQSSNNCFLQIYGTGFDTGETVATVLLFFDQQRFVFNVGEGLQRFCTEHRIKLSKVVLLTCMAPLGVLPCHPLQKCLLFNEPV
ncbi:hypothetical protein L7F22_068477 [Adiantum nelumboides]|nr:hypothetical protein [Adiantum nelumboides]